MIYKIFYNLADTFFIGQIGNPYMVAAVSLVSPWFNLLTALGNLFGLGGGLVTLVFSLLTFVFRQPLPSPGRRQSLCRHALWLFLRYLLRRFCTCLFRRQKPVRWGLNFCG